MGRATPPLQATTTEEVKSLLASYKRSGRTWGAGAGGGRMREPAGALSLAATAVGPPRRKDKENMADFIEKKREIFLLQVGSRGL